MSLRRLISCVVVAGFALGAQAAWAGVTVHYEGKAHDRSAVDEIMSIVRAEAVRNGWEIKDASVPAASITRIIDGKDIPYRGPLNGVVLFPDPMCEPLYFQFGSDLFMQDFVKTQFGGPDVHVSIIEILRKLKPFFSHLKVEDEGDYWSTGNRKTLEGHMQQVNAMIQEIKRARPGVRGPVKVESGRILDILQ